MLRVLNALVPAVCCGALAAAAAGDAGPAQAASPAGALPPALVLRECRLEHPQRLASAAARCGELKVPEDRTAPGGATLALNIAVIPALNRHTTAAPLFVLAGGPGQSAVAMYMNLAPAFARLGRNHDIVLVDQRGTGKSAPLSCDYPEDWQSSDDILPAVRLATAACLAKYGERVRFYTTSAAVADLDAVREALRLPTINLYGVSYGTRVAELYMRRYPHTVRAAILDGVIYPAEAIGATTPLDAERALDLIVSRCKASPGCAAAFPELAQDLVDLRRRYGPEHRSITLADPDTGQPLTVTFNRSMLNASLRFLSYSATQAALLPMLVHAGAQGELAPLASQTVMMGRQVADQLASGMQNSVICSEDAPLFATSDNDHAAIARTYQGADQLEAFHAICSLWPRGPVDADLHSPLRSDIPTLLLSGEADPVTPPADAERTAAGLTRHIHLILDGEGHGQIATGCVPKLMAQFLDAEVPEKVDSDCLKQHRPAPFFVSMTGPPP